MQGKIKFEMRNSLKGKEKLYEMVDHVQRGAINSNGKE